jgi:hypothetical protein
MYMLLKYSNSGKFPAFYESFLAKRAVEFQESTLEKIDGLVKSLKSVKAQSLIDILTFSVLPARFHFFFTTFGTAAFISFLGKVDDPCIRSAFARMAFMSPFFLAFIADVFRPILSPMLSSSSPELLREDLTVRLSDSIIERWSLHAARVRYFIGRLFACLGQDAARVFSDSFFKIALAKQNACFFGLIEFNQTIPESLLALLRSLLTIESQSNILNELVENIGRQQFQSHRLLDIDDRRAAPALFQRILVSSLDDEGWACIRNQVEFSDSTRFRVWARMAKGEEEKQSIHNLLEQTMANDTGSNAALRHLLQAADPLPDFQCAPRGMSIHQFFVDYVLTRGSRETLDKRFEAMDTLEKKHCLKSERSVHEFLKGVRLERTKELLALSVFRHIQEKFIFLNEECREICDDVETVLFSIPIHDFLFKHGLHNKSKDVMKSMDDLDVNYSRAIAEYEREAKGGCILTYFMGSHRMIILGFLTAHFDFHVFRGKRRDLKSLDAKMSELFKTECDAVIARVFPRSETPPDHGRFNKALALARQTEILKRDRDDILEIVRGAFMEPTPLRKMKELLHGRVAIEKFYNSVCPPSVELGEDDWMPIMAVSLFLAQPQFAASNYAFLSSCSDKSFQHVEKTCCKATCLAAIGAAFQEMKTLDLSPLGVSSDR